MKRLWLICVLLAVCSASAQTGDVLGAHNMSAETSPVKGRMANACLYCHAPHSGTGAGPLWAQKLSTQTYSLYTSDTIQNTTTQPTLGASSTLCLSCHDGTVATGLRVPSGQVQMTGTMSSVLGTNMEGSHPFSLTMPLKDSSTLAASLAASHTTTDPTQAVKLVNGNVECTSCHNPHKEITDQRARKFLVRDNANGAICLSCHETAPRTVNTRPNPLAQWPTSVHATAAAQVAPSAGMGNYATVAEFACLSCHVTHNAAADSGLLRKPVPSVPNMDTTAQNCLTCHNGSDKLVQPIANVLAEFDKKGHPLPTAGNAHSSSEPVVLQNNRHATCADCHNAHAAKKVATFGPAPDIRASQYGVSGVAADGATLSAPATKQYENCLRCHGSSAGKQALVTYGYLPVRTGNPGDPLNLIPQFSDTALSRHPVAHDATLASQPSLLEYMWDLTGNTPKRPMGTRILCTDCHNSDNNREFGGTGPNGPHGSKNSHILERRYESSQVAAGSWPTGGPGSSVINLFPNPQLAPSGDGPYALCAKCHDLNNVVSNASFAKHAEHINRGFSCSVCHTAHGVPSSTTLTGKRLVDFDVNVVAPNAGVLSYTNNTCTLRCHSADHNADGTVTPAAP